MHERINGNVCDAAVTSFDVSWMGAWRLQMPMIEGMYANTVQYLCILFFLRLSMMRVSVCNQSCGSFKGVRFSGERLRCYLCVVSCGIAYTYSVKSRRDLHRCRILPNADWGVVVRCVRGVTSVSRLHLYPSTL